MLKFTYTSLATHSNSLRLHYVMGYVYVGPPSTLLRALAGASAGAWRKGKAVDRQISHQFHEQTGPIP